MKKPAGSPLVPGIDMEKPAGSPLETWYDCCGRSSERSEAQGVVDVRAKRAASWCDPAETAADSCAGRAQRLDGQERIFWHGDPRDVLTFGSDGGWVNRRKAGSHACADWTARAG